MSVDLRRLEMGLIPFFVAFLSIASAKAATRWDSIAYAAANPVVMQGSLVVHDNGGDVFAFSATSQRFAKIAPTGSSILGSGDELVVVRVGPAYRAWSARLNQTADIAQNLPLVHTAFGDDVALLVFGTGIGSAVACAYSAVTNQWKSISGTFAGTIASNAAVSRFVIALRTTGGVYGFSARKGEWVLLPSSTAASTPAADGNVAVTSGAFNPLDPLGPPVAAAFSGVLGNWALSPPILAGSAVQIDHNVALCRTVAGATEWVASGYSAYNGRWVTSTAMKHKIAFGQSVHLSDNVVAIVGSSDTPPGIEAFGARPGLGFAYLASTIGGVFVPIGQDYLICQPSLLVKTVHAFSGLCGGTFKPYAYTNSFSGGFGGVHQFLAVDNQNKVVAYSAATHTFVDMPLPTAYDFAQQDAVGEMRQSSVAGTRFHSFAARHGHFTSSPNQEVGAMFVTASAGSLVSRQQMNGVGAGGILVYDERCDRYPAPYQPGAPSKMTAGRNVLLISLAASPQEVTGYSVARGDWVKSPSSASSVPMVLPLAEDNVGYFVDGSAQLCAFGGDGDLHAFYSWPNDTEFQTNGVASGQLVIPPSPLGLAFAGEPSDLAFGMYSLGFVHPGAAIAGYQNPLHLAPATLAVFGPLGPIGASRILALTTTGSVVSAPSCVQLWLQCVLTGGPSGNWLGQRCEGVWFF
ncbi:MAG: hypothetical protein IPH13_03685 [Planctomycetes bacterium]|nr:hypothetical protein [Planctomycetota bacterium]MCC7172710.1 hypothetical protein [Planctomycetota bacterium]